MISTLSISGANEFVVASERLSQEKVSDLEQCNTDEEICIENAVDVSSTEKQASGDDESRPSDSISAEGQDEMFQEEQDQETESKNAPDPLRINETERASKIQLVHVYAFLRDH